MPSRGRSGWSAEPWFGRDEGHSRQGARFVYPWFDSVGVHSVKKHHPPIDPTFGVRPRFARVKRACCVVGIAWVVATNFVGFGSVGPASAAERTPGPVNDDLTCSSVGYNPAGTTGNTVVHKCYAASAFPAGWPGTSKTFGTTVGFLVWYGNQSATVRFDSGVGCSSGTAWYGPQTTARWGSIPARAVVVEQICGNDTNGGWRGYNSGATATLSTVVPYGCATSNSGSLAMAADTVDADRRETCFSWGGIATSLAVVDAVAWPVDWYTGGSGFVTHPCSGVTVATTPLVGSPAAPFSVSVTGTVSGLTIDVQLRPGAPWTPVAPVPGTVSVPVFGAPLSVEGLLFRCQANGSGFRYQLGSFNASSSWPSSSPLSVSACGSSVLTWPASALASSTSAVFTFAVPEGSTVTSLEWTVIDPSAVSQVPGSASVWTTAVSAVVGPASPTFTVTGLTAGASMSQLFFRCKDSAGYKTNAQYAATFVYDPAKGGNADECAEGGSGILGGVGTAVKCAFLWLLIPSESQLNSLSSSWGGTWLSRFLSPVSSTVAGFWSLSTSYSNGGGDNAGCWGPMVELDLGNSYSGSLETAWFPFAACASDPDGRKENAALAYFRAMTIFLSRLGAGLWMVFRLKKIYLSLAAP